MSGSSSKGRRVMARNTELFGALGAGWIPWCLWLTLAGCAHGAWPELPREAWATAPAWPRAPQEARIVWVGEIRHGADIVTSKGLWGWLGETLAGEEPGVQFDRPMGLALDPRGRLWMTDTAQGAVFVFAPADAATHRFTETIAGPLVSPVGVVVAPSGMAYVSDSARGWVALFGSDGESMGVFGQGELERPTGLALRDGGHELLVADTVAHTVVVYDLDPATGLGRRVGTVGERGEGTGRFNFPVFLAEGVDGGVWVGDAMNARVQRFNAQGEFVSSFGQRGDSAGSFASLKGLAVDSGGHVYAADALFDNVQIFDPQGQLLLVFGERGHGPGQLWLPEDIVIDPEGRIFIADALNRRVQIFRYLPRRTP